MRENNDSAADAGSSLREGEKLERVIFCDFCGKSQHYVKVMIAAPRIAHICDECVELCAQIIKEREDGNDNGNQTASEV